MKKTLSVILLAILTFTLLAACGDGSSSTPAPANQNTPRPPIGSTQAPASQNAPAPSTPAPTPASNFNTNREIIVVSRESGSGTRGAFIEITGVQVSADGTTRDRTYAEAVIGNNTNAIMTNVAGDTFAIGYISSGSVNDTIKAVNIEGVAPTAANILTGDYLISRPFIIITGSELSDVAQDFVNFILAKEGQDRVVERGFVSVDGNAAAFVSNRASGTIVVGGSTSVEPLMGRLREDYLAINPNAIIEVHGTGSGAGITGAMDGVVDIGMSSREIRDSERERLDQVITIAVDGIAVIVNNDNPLDNLTMDEVRDIFIGETTRWSALLP